MVHPKLLVLHIYIHKSIRIFLKGAMDKKIGKNYRNKTTSSSFLTNDSQLSDIKFLEKL